MSDRPRPTDEYTYAPSVTPVPGGFMSGLSGAVNPRYKCNVSLASESLRVLSLQVAQAIIPHIHLRELYEESEWLYVRSFSGCFYVSPPS